MKPNVRIVNLPQQEISKIPENCVQTPIISEIDEYNDYFFQYLTEKVSCLLNSFKNLLIFLLVAYLKPAVF